jgi:nucleobase:cation symporter-1, NCS1 family
MSMDPTTEPIPSAATAPGDEFERTPVPAEQQKPARSFWGMYAGEHTAGTEFMIGPLFLAAGVSAFDLVAGLLLGNLMAVLSWRFLCAPVATRSRLTLYYQLERISGRKFVVVYNLANGLLFCFLAGSMITVSATAVGLPLNMRMPALTDIYPTGFTWIAVVLVIGAVISWVAARGYDMVSRVANHAAPWMITIFLVCGLTALPKLGIEHPGQFWATAREFIWTGGDPLPGQIKFTFWHVFFFAWFCNAAMHFGMADLSVLRFARKASYGWASAAGMYIGHFMAWIAASLLFAVHLRQNPGDHSVLPGPMAAEAVGLAGLLCVVIAGWTTANPTIYRAGLAFQAIFPRQSRYRVTLVTGMLATCAGMFPAIAMQLLGFVGLYGMILAPVGAVILADHFILPRINRVPEYALHHGTGINPAVVAAWLLSLAMGFVFLRNGVYPSFLTLPVWLTCGAVYVLYSRFLQRS